MIGRALASRLAIALVAVVASLAAPGCGGGSGYHGPEGSLEVENLFESTFRVVQIDIDEVGGPDFFSYDVDLFPGDQSIFFYLFPASYDVTVYWDDSTVDVYAEDVFDGVNTYRPVLN